MSLESRSSFSITHQNTVFSKYYQSSMSEPNEHNLKNHFMQVQDLKIISSFENLTSSPHQGYSTFLACGGHL